MAFLIANLLSAKEEAEKSIKAGEGIGTAIRKGLQQALLGDKPKEIEAQVKKAREEGKGIAGQLLAGGQEAALGGGQYLWTGDPEDKARFDKNVAKAKEVISVVQGVTGGIEREQKITDRGGDPVSTKQELESIATGFIFPETPEERKKRQKEGKLDRKQLIDKLNKGEPIDILGGDLDKMRKDIKKTGLDIEDFELIPEEKPQVGQVIPQAERRKTQFTPSSYQERVDNILQEPEEFEEELFSKPKFIEPELSTEIDPRLGFVQPGEKITNPLTGRKIKVGGREYKRLVDKKKIKPVTLKEYNLKLIQEGEEPIFYKTKEHFPVELSPLEKLQLLSDEAKELGKQQEVELLSGTSKEFTERESKSKDLSELVDKVEEFRLGMEKDEERINKFGKELEEKFKSRGGKRTKEQSDKFDKIQSKLKKRKTETEKDLKKKEKSKSRLIEKIKEFLPQDFSREDIGEGIASYFDPTYESKQTGGDGSVFVKDALTHWLEPEKVVPNVKLEQQVKEDKELKKKLMKQFSLMPDEKPNKKQLMLPPKMINDLSNYGQEMVPYVGKGILVDHNLDEVEIEEIFDEPGDIAHINKVPRIGPISTKVIDKDHSNLNRDVKTILNQRRPFNFVNLTDVIDVNEPTPGVNSGWSTSVIIPAVATEAVVEGVAKCPTKKEKKKIFKKIKKTKSKKKKRLLRAQLKCPIKCPKGYRFSERLQQCVKKKKKSK